MASFRNDCIQFSKCNLQKKELPLQLETYFVYKELRICQVFTNKTKKCVHKLLSCLSQTALGHSPAPPASAFAYIVNRTTVRSAHSRAPELVISTSLLRLIVRSAGIRAKSTSPSVCANSSRSYHQCVLCVCFACVARTEPGMNLARPDKRASVGPRAAHPQRQHVGNIL